MHGTEAPSPWVQRFAYLVAPAATVLDLACGLGRHARFFAARGCRVVAVDRDAAAGTALAAIADVTFVQADLEAAPWPLPGRTFDAIVVTNYLHRPLFPVLLQSLAPGGVLVYETFAAGNELFGKPSNPAFLLRPGELLELIAPHLHVLAYEDGLIEQPRQARVQRLVALRAGGAGGMSRLRLPPAED